MKSANRFCTPSPSCAIAPAAAAALRRLLLLLLPAAATSGYRRSSGACAGQSADRSVGRSGWGFSVAFTTTAAANNNQNCVKRL